MTDNEENMNTYEVGIPMYEIVQEGRIEVPDDQEPPISVALDDLDSVRYETSDIHLDSSLFFADEAKRIEDFVQRDSEQTSEEKSDVKLDGRLPLGNRHDLYVVSSIVSSVSMLEALVNEFYERHVEAANNSDKVSNKQKEEQYVSDPVFINVL